MRAIVPLLLLSALPSLASAQQAPPPAPRYLPAIVAELEALSIPHACEAVSASMARCSFPQRLPASGREVDVHVVYSDDSDTVYFYVSRYLLAPPEAPSTEAVLRRLMELNWQLLVPKLEWDPSSGEVRLSMTMSTDSNFDRRTFRSLARQITAVADRHHGELQRLAGPAAGAAEGGAGATPDAPARR